MALRVHQLAKELGVKSAAIVSKCQAEGLDVKNHMSTLSIGLGETIREWFSEGEHTTTVESSAKVDLAKVKTKTKRKKKAEAAEGAEVAETATAVSVIDAPAPPVEEAATESPSVETKAKAKVARPKRQSPKEIEAEAVPVETPAAQAPEFEGDEGKELDEQQAVAAVAEPPAKEPDQYGQSDSGGVEPLVAVEPDAPEQYVPAPAKLQGPNIVRVERPDIVRAPVSRRPAASPVQAGSEPPTSSSESASDSSSRRGSRKRTLQGGSEDGRSGDRRSKPRTGKGRGGQSDGAGKGSWGDRDLQERQERLARASGTQLHRRERRLAQSETTGAGKTPIASRAPIEAATIQMPFTVKALSGAIGVRSNEIIGKLMGMGVLATINQVIDAETAQTVALEFGVELTVEAKVLLIDRIQQEFDQEVSEEELSPRPPIVTFLGHVDHGKTSLLDRIRQAKVVEGEAGGITQHIGSYLYDDGKRRVTFLDTPGHKAFTAMRARGANLTDIVVLVVAGDDGVMPQTEEAINHAKAAGVPIVVALNKVDLPNFDENRVLGQLSEKGLVPSMWGGDIEVVRTSATTGEGIEDLVEYLDYVAELRQLRAKAEGPATGWVVESEMTTGQGAVARLLVKSGTLRLGDVVVSGCAFGKVRTIMDGNSQRLSEAPPASPIEITGLDEVPIAGDRFFVLESASQAKDVADEQRSQQRERTLAVRRQVTLENLFSEIKAEEIRELNVILKADFQGSVDVLSKSILEMNTSEVAVRVLHAAVGGITESDILLAEASNAIIIGFQVIADDHCKRLSETKGVEIRLYRVIYQIGDDIKKALEGMLAPRIEEKELGRAEVRQVFRVSRFGNIAGCYVTDGLIRRSAMVRLIRDQIVIRDQADIESLRRVKDDAAEVRHGLECGIKIAKFDDIKVGDTIEAYEHIKVSRTLDSVE